MIPEETLPDLEDLTLSAKSSIREAKTPLG